MVSGRQRKTLLQAPSTISQKPHRKLEGLTSLAILLPANNGCSTGASLPNSGKVVNIGHSREMTVEPITSISLEHLRTSATKHMKQSTQFRATGNHAEAGRLAMLCGENNFRILKQIVTEKKENFIEQTRQPAYWMRTAYILAMRDYEQATPKTPEEASFFKDQLEIARTQANLADRMNTGSKNPQSRVWIPSLKRA